MALTLDGTAGITLPTWTTAGRPANPGVGQFGFNTTIGTVEIYLNGWIAVSNTIPVKYLAVGGGGGGGNNGGGGGGAGGFLNGTVNFTTGVTYTITVGAGGTAGNTGGNSSISGLNITTITSLGGGGGATRDGGGAGKNGASSGGGAGNIAGNTNGNRSGTPTYGQGYPGGNGTGELTTSSAGGGGGGAGWFGTAAESQLSGIGGDGLQSSITGNTVTYCGGGGGGITVNGTGGAGGSGGGGAGANGGANAISGTANTGGGGGAGGANAGRGGSGIVVLNFPKTYTPTSTTGNITVGTEGTNKYYAFTSSGTITF